LVTLAEYDPEGVAFEYPAMKEAAN